MLHFCVYNLVEFTQIPSSNQRVQHSCNLFLICFQQPNPNLSVTPILVMAAALARSTMASLPVIVRKDLPVPNVNTMSPRQTSQWPVSWEIHLLESSHLVIKTWFDDLIILVNVFFSERALLKFIISVLNGVCECKWYL